MDSARTSIQRLQHMLAHDVLEVTCRWWQAKMSAYLGLLTIAFGELLFWTADRRRWGHFKRSTFDLKRLRTIQIWIVRNRFKSNVDLLRGFGRMLGSVRTRSLTEQQSICFRLSIK